MKAIDGARDRQHKRKTIGRGPGQDHPTTCGPEHAAFVVRYALENTKAADGTREAAARGNAQCRRERDERVRRRRLADRRVELSDEVLAALRRRAEVVLATDGVERMRLGYEVLVKLTVDELLEREGHGLSARPNGSHTSARVSPPSLPGGIQCHPRA